MFNEKQREENLTALMDAVEKIGLNGPEFLIAAADLAKQTPVYFFQQVPREVQDASSARMQIVASEIMQVFETHEASFAEHLLVLLALLQTAGEWYLELDESGAEAEE